MTDRIKEIIKRIVVAIILIPISVILILYAPPIILFLSILLLIIGLTYEFIALMKQKNKFINTYIVYVSAIIIPSCLFFKLYLILILYLFILLLLLLLLKMFSNNPIENAFEEVFISYLSSIFIPLLASAMFLLDEISPLWLLYLAIVIWLSDIFAYFVGIGFGKHKLIPSISPKKTIEGLIGGIIFATIGGLIFNYLFLEKSMIFMIIITLEIITVGVIGDLIESMLKRSANVKDSGSIIPGHGGIYDRLDSILLAAPLLLLYINILDKYLPNW